MLDTQAKNGEIVERVVSLLYILETIKRKFK